MKLYVFLVCIISAVVLGQEEGNTADPNAEESETLPVQGNEENSSSTKSSSSSTGGSTSSTSERTSSASTSTASTSSTATSPSTSTVTTTTEEAVFPSNNRVPSSLTSEMKDEIMQLLVNYFSNQKKTTTRRPFTRTTDKVTSRPSITGLPIVPGASNGFSGNNYFYPGQTENRKPEIFGSITYPDSEQERKPENNFGLTNEQSGSRTDFKIPRVPGLLNNRYPRRDNTYNLDNQRRSVLRPWMRRSR